MIEIVGVHFRVGEAKHTVILISTHVHIDIEYVIVLVHLNVSDESLRIRNRHYLRMIDTGMIDKLDPFTIELSDIWAQDLGF